MECEREAVVNEKGSDYRRDKYMAACSDVEWCVRQIAVVIPHVVQEELM